MGLFIFRFRDRYFFILTASLRHNCSNIISSQLIKIKILGFPTANESRKPQVVIPNLLNIFFLSPRNLFFRSVEKFLIPLDNVKVFMSKSLISINNYEKSRLTNLTSLLSLGILKLVLVFKTMTKYVLVSILTMFSNSAQR